MPFSERSRSAQTFSRVTPGVRFRGSAVLAAELKTLSRPLLTQPRDGDSLVSPVYYLFVSFPVTGCAKQADYAKSCPQGFGHSY